MRYPGKGLSLRRNGINFQPVTMRASGKNPGWFDTKVRNAGMQECRMQKCGN
jgi:hypothetical protein